MRFQGFLIIAALLMAAPSYGAPSARERCQAALEGYLSEHPEIRQNQLRDALYTLDEVRRQMQMEASYLATTVGTDKRLGLLHGFRSLVTLARRGQSIVAHINRFPPGVFVTTNNPRDLGFRDDITRNLLTRAVDTAAREALLTESSVGSNRVQVLRNLRDSLERVEDLLAIDEDLLPNLAVSAGEPAVTMAELSLSSVASTLPAAIQALSEGLTKEKSLELYRVAVEAEEAARLAERQSRTSPNEIENAVNGPRQPLIERQAELWASSAESVATVVTEALGYLSVETSRPHQHAARAGIMAVIAALQNWQPSHREITPAVAERILFSAIGGALRAENLPVAWLEFFVDGKYRLGLATQAALERGENYVLNMETQGLGAVLLHPVLGADAPRAELVRVGTTVHFTKNDPRVPPSAAIIAIDQSGGNMVRVMVEGAGTEGRVIQRWVPKELLPYMAAGAGASAAPAATRRPPRGTGSMLN